MELTSIKQKSSIEKNLGYFIFLGFFWLLSPYLGILMALLLVFKIDITRNSFKVISCFISLSFGLLAFTQKSLYWDGTDITRYYYEYAPLVNYDISVAPLLLGSEILTYVFTPINVIIVLSTKNVQTISLFWTFFIYYVFFLSIWNFLEIFYKSKITNRNLIFCTFFFSIYGAILFTQVTETIKSAAAITLFWYIFTEYIKKGWSFKIPLLLFICTGIHAQTLMLIPIFLYKKFNYKSLCIITFLVIFFSTQINILNIIFSILPSSGWTELLISRVSNYGLDTGETSSKRYILEGILCLLVSIYLYRRGIYNKSNKLGNIVLLYILIMFLNFNNSNAFIRFANFISYIIVIEFIGLYVDKKIRQLSILYLSIFIILNIQMTYGRTLSGGYCSSYMDNSIIKILFSNIYDYMSFEAYSS